MTEKREGQKNLTPRNESNCKGHSAIVPNQNHNIVYRIEKNTIFITDIFDSRQDPAKQKP